MSYHDTTIQVQFYFSLIVASSDVGLGEISIRMINNFVFFHPNAAGNFERPES